jgi:hypothetical protein
VCAKVSRFFHQINSSSGELAAAGSDRVPKEKMPRGDNGLVPKGPLPLPHVNHTLKREK